jgi:hypothetical protein
MLRRYPHTAKIITVVESEASDGINVLTPTETDVVGRYEPVGQSQNLDYSAKFYCPINAFAPFQADGNQLVYNGRQFKIVQLFNYQTHGEIWLE